MKRWLIMLGAVVLVVVAAGGLWRYNLSQKMATFNAAQPKQAVSTQKAALQPWRERIQAVGSIHAVRGADLAAEVEGVVEVVHFESGSDTKTGAVLLELRAGEDRAKLDSFKAAADLADSVYRRSVQQFDAKIISQSQLDSDAAALKSAKAQVAEQQALVDKKVIRAPFAGHLGIRAVDEGQFVTPGTKLVTLQALDPIHVDFSLPQQQLARLKVGQQVTLTTDIYGDQNFIGKITAIDPAVNVETRSVQVRATLKNPERKLLPGMFARVDIEVGEPQSYVTLPLSAIAFNPYGETVFVIIRRDQLRQSGGNEKAVFKEGTKTGNEQPQENGAELVAQQIFVTTGARRGDQVAVLTGLKPGDQVVTAGQLKLRNGVAVLINNSVRPANDPAPQPREE